MAFVVKQDKRIEHPTEPGTWAVIRVPLSAGDYALARGGSAAAASLDILPHVIAEWSYDAPITRESLESLDLETFAWLDREVAEASPLRSDAEKKASSGDSSATTAPVEASTQPSSLT